MESIFTEDGIIPIQIPQSFAQELNIHFNIADEVFKLFPIVKDSFVPYYHAFTHETDEEFKYHNYTHYKDCKDCQERLNLKINDGEAIGDCIFCGSKLGMTLQTGIEKHRLAKRNHFSCRSCLKQGSLVDFYQLIWRLPIKDVEKKLAIELEDRKYLAQLSPLL